MDVKKLHEDWFGVLEILLSTKTHLHVPGLSNKFEDAISVSVCECSADKIVFKSKCYIHAYHRYNDSNTRNNSNEWYNYWSTRLAKLSVQL